MGQQTEQIRGRPRQRDNQCPIIDCRDAELRRGQAARRNRFGVDYIRQGLRVERRGRRIDETAQTKREMLCGQRIAI